MFKLCILWGAYKDSGSASSTDAAADSGFVEQTVSFSVASDVKALARDINGSGQINICFRANLDILV